jgi:aminoglycoside 3-N-acetyltransferase
MYTRQSLFHDLQKLGLKSSDTVLIHSSMKSLGKIENGAEGFLQTLTEYFADGLVAFPTLSWDLVNGRQPVFSVRDTPSTTGVLPELFRKFPGVKRSLHPTHSITAWGKDAEAFLSGHEKFDSPCHRNSPWGKLYDRRAKILFVGTTIICNTFLHGVEEWLPVPGMLTEYAENLVVFDYNGNRIEVPSRRHDGDHSQYYAVMEERFRECGALSEGRLGDAHVFVLDAQKAGDCTFELLQKNSLFFTDEFQKPVE